MFTMRRLIIVATAAALMTGCAGQNPYDNQGQAQGSTGMSKTAKYGGLGALAGAIAGLFADRLGGGWSPDLIWTAATVPVAAALAVSMVRDMLAGRLEIFPMLVLFLPDTWRKF